LIFHLKNDETISDTGMQEIIRALQKNGHKNLYFLVIEDPAKKIKHAKLSASKQFQQVCNAFLAFLGQPHNAELAQGGAHLLALAQENAYAETIADWKIVQNQ
jgi:hypothetical protein